MNFEVMLFLIFIFALLVIILISKRQSIREQIREDYQLDGFLDPHEYDFALTDHACERMAERLGIYDYEAMKKKASLAYRFGVSKRQADSKTAGELNRIEMKNENSVVLLYDGCIYIFSRDNVLITVYRFDEKY